MTENNDNTGTPKSPSGDLGVNTLDLISSITTESFYVINVVANRFSYVSPHDLFLCGHSVEEALQLGDNFYKKIVYPNDLLLWEKMRKAVLSYLKDSDEDRDKVDYFSCTFRLQRNFSFLPPRPLPQMVYHRIKPVWVENELWYLICFLRNSTVKKSGNLHLYYKDGLTHKEYNTTTQRWKVKPIEPLTERERAILLLAKEGKNVKEIANYLHRGFHTIRNQITALFQKLKVNSIQEAVDFAFEHRMLYVSKEVVQKPESMPFETPRKKIRVLLTTDRLQRIQQHLNDGKSIRQAAKLEGIAESVIRYWINKRKIFGCSNAVETQKSAQNTLL